MWNMCAHTSKEKETSCVRIFFFQMEFTEDLQRSHLMFTCIFFQKPQNVL